jgi:hypothetical protein
MGTRPPTASSAVATTWDRSSVLSLWASPATPSTVTPLTLYHLEGGPVPFKRWTVKLGSSMN